MQDRSVRLVSIPEAHPYIDAIVDSEHVIRVSADPAAPPVTSSSPAAAWAPPAALDSEWVHRNHERFDTIHVHFGFESFSADHVSAFVDAVQVHGKNLFVTVHDLSNPQLPAEGQDEYLAALDALVAHADRVITLTPSAARRIDERWGITAVVIEHPPHFGDDMPAGLSSPRGHRPQEPRRAGVLLKDARPSLDLSAIGGIAEAMASAPDDDAGWRLDVVHHGRFRAGREDDVASLLERLADNPIATVTERGRMSDAELNAWVAGLDFLVLPYGHGSHSGLLELANDLGVRVMVTDCGHFADQRPGTNTVFSFTDPEAAVQGLAAAVASEPLAESTGEDRRRKLASVRAEHLLLYRRAQERLERLKAGRHPLRILVIGPFRYPLAQPHAGGLESHVWALVRALRERGHSVTLAAQEGSDFIDGTPEELVYPSFPWPEGVPRSDSMFPPEVAALEDEVMERVMSYASAHAGDYDIIHNHCLHGAPHQWAARVEIPMMTTLHTPPFPELVEAITSGSGRGEFFAVSHHTARLWKAEGVKAKVIRNGVDTAEWTFGQGGAGLVWFGRIVPEKAPHLAVRAATILGEPLILAGPRSDPAYAEERVSPQMTGPGVWPPLVEVGPLRQKALARLVGESACTLITPDWDEPFGQVVVESLACGTPVVALRRGGLGEIFDGYDAVRLVDPGETEEETSERMAEAVRQTLRDSAVPESGPQLRWAARHTAVERFSFDRTVDKLERRYYSWHEMTCTEKPAAGSHGTGKAGS